MTRIAKLLGSRASVRTLVAATVIVISGLTAYSNSFTELFLGLDGKQSIRDNPHIQRLWPLSEALSLPLWPNPQDLEKIRPAPPRSYDDIWAALTAPANGLSAELHHPLDDTPTVALRPTFSLSLALTNRLLGTSPPAHHAVNLAIHIVAALMMFGLTRRILRRQRFCTLGSARSDIAAFAATLIWLLHPIQTESVTYLVQRAESLMGMFFMLTMYCAVRAVDSPRRLSWQLAAVVACGLGAGAKQTAVFVAPLILIYDYIFPSRSTPRWSRPYFYVLLLAPLIVVLITHGMVSDESALSSRFEPVRYLTYALAQPAVVMHYLWITIWPDDLYLYVNTKLFHLRSLAQVVVPASILTTVFGATVYAITRRHWLGFVGGWFFLTLGPTSSFFDVVDTIQEHRMYVPLAALALLAVAVGDIAARALSRIFSSPRLHAAVAFSLLLTVAAALGTRTYVRNWDYHSEFGVIHPADLHGNYTILADHFLSSDELLRDEAERANSTLNDSDSDSHERCFAHFVRGLAAARFGELDRAVSEFERVLELDPDFAYAHHWLGLVLSRQEDLPNAIARFKRAVRLNPTLVVARKDMALALKRIGDTQAARRQLELAVEIDPAFGEGYFELGILAFERGKKKEAEAFLNSALRYRPDLSEGHYELGILALERGDETAAEAHLHRAIERSPESIEAHYLLHLLLRARGEAAAAEHAAAVVRLRPDRPEALRELGMLAFELGRIDDAAEAIREALRLRPGFAEAHRDFGIVLSARNQRSEAVAHLEQALGLNPDLPEADYELGILWRDMGDITRAIRHLERAVVLAPESPQAHFDLGQVLRDDGRAGEAAIHLREAYRLDPEVEKANLMTEDSESD